MAHNLHETIKESLFLTRNKSYDLVASVSTNVGDIQENITGEQFLLKIAYEKGTETGLDIWLNFPNSKYDTVTQNREARFEDIGGGVLVHRNQVYRFSATCNTTIPIDCKEALFFQVIQRATGGTPTGRFIMWLEKNKIAR